MGKLYRRVTSALMILCDAPVPARAEIGEDVRSPPSHNLTNGSILCSSAEVAALAEFPLFLLCGGWSDLAPCLDRFDEWPFLPHLVQYF